MVRTGGDMGRGGGAGGEGGGRRGGREREREGRGTEDGAKLARPNFGGESANGTHSPNQRSLRLAAYQTQGMQ